MLSARLQAIADMVPSCRRLVDIGTDHAYLPIALIEQAVCQSAVAADLRPGPLRRARQNIVAAGRGEVISLCLSDGLDQIDLRSDDVVVIAGLGGLEMIRILEKTAWQQQTVILQPMKSAYELRLWLAGHGFEIQHERLADEGRHLYPLLLVTTGQAHYDLSDPDAWFGPDLLRSRPVGFDRYLKRRGRQLELASRSRPQLRSALRTYRQTLSGIEEELI